MMKLRIFCSLVLCGALLFLGGCGVMHELEMTGTYADLWRDGRSATEETAVLCTAEETAVEAADAAEAMDLSADCAASDTEAVAAEIMPFGPTWESDEAQPIEIDLVVNQGEAGVFECLDFQIAACEDAVLLAYDAGLPESFGELTLSSGSIISTPVRTDGTDAEYIFRDRVLTYASVEGGVMRVAVCDTGKLSIRDYYLACSDPAVSDFGGVSVTVVSYEDEYWAVFSVGDKSYDIRAKGISEDALCEVISELCRTKA